MKKIFKISPILLIGATLAAPITTLSACSQNTSVTISVEGDDTNKIQLSSNKAELNKDLSIKVESIDEVKTKANIISIKINNQQVTNYIYDAAAKLLNISAQYVTGNIIINAYISQPVITHNVQLAFEVEGLQLLTFSVEDKKDAIISLKISNFLKNASINSITVKNKGVIPSTTYSISNSLESATITIDKSVVTDDITLDLKLIDADCIEINDFEFIEYTLQSETFNAMINAIPINFQANKIYKANINMAYYTKLPNPIKLCAGSFFYTRDITTSWNWLFFYNQYINITIDVNVLTSPSQYTITSYSSYGNYKLTDAGLNYLHEDSYFHIYFVPKQSVGDGKVSFYLE